MSNEKPSNNGLKHVTVLEEAHNLLKHTSTEQSSESANITGKSVEMITSAIAEMRSYGEAFVIVDQAPGLLDMAVIRNTNTKIIHRLPDITDRELVGRAAGLNDQQIEELAKLECGVAAIYQNNWIEPVLGKVFEFDINKKHSLLFELNSIPDTTKQARNSIRDLLLNSNEFIRINTALVMKSNLSAHIKVLMMNLENGNGRTVEILSKLFYALYPELSLQVLKGPDDNYMDSLKTNITRVCGTLTDKEIVLAMTYYLGILRGFNCVEPQTYSEIREELKNYV